MSCSTRLGAVGGEGAAGAAEVVVEGDAGGEGEQALADPGSEAVQGAAPWRSRVRRSLKVQKMLSMRWRMGARCGPGPGSFLRRGRTISAWRACISAANSRLA